MSATVHRPAWLQSIEGQTLNLKGKHYHDTLFLRCKITSLRGTVLERCSLQECVVEVDSLADLLGVTITMDCFTFEGLELNELAMDAMLWQLASTKGNERKRRLLLEAINPKHRQAFLNLFEHLTRK